MNQSKVCNLCKQDKLLSDFYLGVGKLGRQSYCKTCMYEKVKSRRTKEINKGYKRTAAQKRKPLRELIKTFKETHGCKDCKKKFPHYIMDFDHVTGTKRNNVSTLIHGGCSKEVLITEIEKCEIVCSNCHRERTWQRAKIKK